MTEKVSLEQYQKKLKNWQNKQLSETEDSIYFFYRQLIKDVLATLGSIFAKYEKEGVLTYDVMARFNRIDRLMESLITHVNTMSMDTRNDLKVLLRDSYEHSYSYMGFAIETAIQQQVGYAALTTATVDAALNNPITGLTLNATLEKNRRDIIYTVQQNVTRGLANGSTYRTMANELQKTFQGDYEKAMRVVRTEAHRVNEQASLDSMKRANEKGVKSIKTWHNAGDSRVRKRTKSNKADHRKMEGQSVDVDEMFNLGSGEKGEAPGNTGYAHHDINCRCFLVYDVISIEGPTNDKLANITFEDWKKKNASGIMKLGNKEVREQYHEMVAEIPNLIDRSQPREAQVKQAFNLRNDSRTKAREMMGDVEARKKLDQTRPTKTFEELIESKMKRKNMSKDEAIEDIYKTATKTNKEVDELFGL